MGSLLLHIHEDLPFHPQDPCKEMLGVAAGVCGPRGGWGHTWNLGVGCPVTVAKLASFPFIERLVSRQSRRMIKLLFRGPLVSTLR